MQPSDSARAARGTTGIDRISGNSGTSEISGIFGEAEKGIHAHSFLGTAIVDYVLTLALAMLATATTGTPIVLTTAAAMLLSVAIHAALRVDTRTLRWIKARLPF
jgi:hypothetical protein